MTIFNATNLLTIQELPTGRAGVWFLNWRIKGKPINQRANSVAEDFAGAGLYAICFDDYLIYVGSFLGNKKNSANFSGDVVNSRWWTHVGAITSRGHRMHIAPSSLRELQASLGTNHPLIAGFQRAQPSETLHRGNGNLGPLRRLTFAASHSHEFLAPDVNPEKVLSRFKFVYVRHSQLPLRMNGHDLKIHIEAAERRLIQKLAPFCNTTHVPNGIAAVKVYTNNIEALFEKELEV